MTTEDRNIGGFTVDAKLIIRAWDPWMERVTGIASQDARGRQLLELVPGAEARGLVGLIGEVLEQGTVRVLAPAFHRYLIACPPQHPSARFDQMQQHVTIGPLREGDAVVGAIVTIEDVTERLDRERDLAASAEAAAAGIADTDITAPDAFRAAIRDEDWRRRRQAAEAITRGAAPGLVSTLLAALRDEHKNFGVVSSALQLLAQIDLDVVEPLIGFLASDDADLRIQATLGLGEQRDPRATPALVRALDDPDANVRFHAIEALGKLRAAESVDRLLEVAHSGDFFLAFAALDALARIGDARAARLLIPLLQNEMLRGAVIDALGRLGDESTVAPLAALLDDPSAPVDAIALALTSLQERSIKRYGEGAIIGDLVRQHTSPLGVRRLVDAVAHAEAESVRALAIVLGWLEGDDVQRALARLLGHPDARREVVEGLVRQGRQVTELLVQQLASDELDTRQAAIVALGRIGDRRATAPLLDLMVRDRETVLTAAGALAMIGDAAAFERLFAMVADEEAAVRQAVIAALNSIGHPDMSARVRQLLDSPNANARQSAVKIAGYFGYRDCIDGLLAHCHDANEEVRTAALEHLPFIDDPRVVPTLVEALAIETARARAAAAHALGRIESPSALAPLVAALEDSDSWVRYFAARAVGQHRAAAAVPTLAALLEKDPAMHVRLATVEALGAIGTPDAVHVLSPVCGESGDLAAAALRALGGIEDDSAWPPLREALQSADPRQRMEAIRAVSARGGPDVPSELEWVAAAATDPTIIHEAVHGLGRRAAAGGVDGPPALEALVRLTADPVRREAAVTALGALPTGLSDSVASGLSDPRIDVRTAIVEALGRMRHERATHWLRHALDDVSADVRKAAIAAMAHLGSRGLETRLATLARSDPDASVRRAARTALGYSNGPDAEGEHRAGPPTA